MIKKHKQIEKVSVKRSSLNPDIQFLKINKIRIKRNSLVCDIKFAE